MAKQWWVYYKDSDCADDSGDRIEVFESYKHFYSELNIENVISTRKVYYSEMPVTIYEMKYASGEYRYFSVMDIGFTEPVEIIVSNKLLDHKVKINEDNETEALIEMGLYDEEEDEIYSENEDFMWSLESDEFGYVGIKHIILKKLLKANINFNDLFEEA